MKMPNPIKYLKALFARRYLVRITFKGGATLVAEFTEFDTTREGGELTKITWAQNKWCRNQLMYLSLKGIDAIDVLNP